jgi:predicted AlkP superfamily pyrophosphatase or phosphodiesterase
LGLLFAAYKASHKRPTVDLAKLTLSNGTDNFAPTTIIISLDGFRADFLQRGLTPTLNAFIEDGISPHYMLPSFPSVTFPNHFTLVTGLYPESHGVVGNSFWDTELQEEFYYTDPARSMQPKWWKGEPLWVTAEDQGVRSAIHMWPGSEAHIGDFEPTYVDVFNKEEKLSNKVKRVFTWLDTPGPDHPRYDASTPRPQLIAAYVPNVDADGHLYGPNSTEIRSTIHDVDDMLNDLFEGLEQRNLTNIVNVVVVSDHGMATTSVNRLLQLEDLIDTSLIEHTDGWPLYGLRPKHASDLMPLYNLLKEKAKEIDSIEVYLRDEDMPERYHFSKNERIAPLWIVPKTGWAIVTRDEFDVKKGLKEDTVYHPRGLHGYDHENPLMRAIFVARGPAFPHKPGSRVENFQNIEVYNIICDSIGVKPVANNGTLRLPLKPVGLHSDEDASPPNAPADPPSDATAATVSLASLTKSTSGVASATPTGAGNGDSTNPSEDGKPEKQDWFSWISSKTDDLKDWAWSLFHKGDSDTDD